MPAEDNHSDRPRSQALHDKETPHNRLQKPQPSSTNPIRSQQSGNRPTATTAQPRHHDEDVHRNERDSRKDPRDTSSANTTGKTPPSSADCHKAQSDLSNSNQEATSEGHSSKNQHVPKKPTSNTDSTTSRHAQDTHPSKDLQHPHGATEGTSAASRNPSPMRSQDAQASGHLPEDEQQATQASGYGLFDSFKAMMPGAMMPGAPPAPPKDKYQHLYYQTRDDLRHARVTIDNYGRELNRKDGELRRCGQYVGQLQYDIQRSKDYNNTLQNELKNVHKQLEDAKTLSEVRGKELVGSQVFLTKADTLSISEVGEKVTALNEEIFQAAATLGDALIYHRHEVTDWDAATAVSQEMVGVKMTDFLITQSQKQDPEVNPLLIQVVLQIFMVKFCVSKIQSWYPDSTIEGFLSAIYSDIRSTEEQAVSGRWRALIRARTRPSTETWENELYQKLQSVLKIASWTISSRENGESFLHRLTSIFKAINELRTAIGEGFTSAELDVFVYECGRSYDPAMMDDAYGDGRKSSGKRVPEAIVGTTGIGLVKVTSERSAADAFRLQDIILPKIVLGSTLKEALEPIKATRRNTSRRNKPAENTDGAHPESRGGSKGKADDNKMDSSSG